MKEKVVYDVRVIEANTDTFPNDFPHCDSFYQVKNKMHFDKDLYAFKQLNITFDVYRNDTFSMVLQCNECNSQYYGVKNLLGRTLFTQNGLCNSGHFSVGPYGFFSELLLQPVFTYNSRLQFLEFDFSEPDCGTGFNSNINYKGASWDTSGNYIPDDALFLKSYSDSECIFEGKVQQFELNFNDNGDSTNLCRMSRIVWVYDRQRRQIKRVHCILFLKRTGVVEADKRLEFIIQRKEN